MGWDAKGEGDVGWADHLQRGAWGDLNRARQPRESRRACFSPQRLSGGEGVDEVWGMSPASSSDASYLLLTTSTAVRPDPGIYYAGSSPQGCREGQGGRAHQPTRDGRARLRRAPQAHGKFLLSIDVTCRYSLCSRRMQMARALLSGTTTTSSNSIKWSCCASSTSPKGASSRSLPSAVQADRSS